MHMAHARSVKPEYFSHEGIAELSPTARLAYIGVWTQTDKYGHFEWRPKKLKSVLFPYDDVDFEALLEEIRSHKDHFILKYSVNGDDFGLIPNWSKHQLIPYNEQKARHRFPCGEYCEHGPFPLDPNPPFPTICAKPNSDKNQTDSGTVD